MNKLRFLFYGLILLGFAFVSSCSEDGADEIPESEGVLIVNEGNFGAGNGSLSIYEETNKFLRNNIVKNANGGSSIGATVQSFYAHDGIGYIICNSNDKIEFISLEDFTFLANPVTELSQPRYMTIIGDRGYITCWGPWDNWTLPDSYVAVMDLTTNTIIDSLDCGSGPEGIIAVDNRLFIANSFETTISVLDLANQSHTKIDLDNSPQHLVFGGSGDIWVSQTNGLQAIDPGTLDLGKMVDVINMNGKIAISPEGKDLYIMTVEPWDENKVNLASQIKVFDTETQQLKTSALINGFDFYGIGVNPISGAIYVADSKAFSGPGEIFVYDEDGNLLDQQAVGVGPNGFVF